MKGWAGESTLGMKVLRAAHDCDVELLSQRLLCVYKFFPVSWQWKLSFLSAHHSYPGTGWPHGSVETDLTRKIKIKK
jgi:hypothetical protein